MRRARCRCKQPIFGESLRYSEVIDRGPPALAKEVGRSGERLVAPRLFLCAVSSNRGNSVRKYLTSLCRWGQTPSIHPKGTTFEFR